MSTTAASDMTINIGKLGIRYLIDGTATGGMGVFELTVPPDAKVPPPHSHTSNEECAYCLEGTLRYSVDGVVRDLTPGEWMFTPRGSVHQFSNTGDETARALIVLTPDIGAQYFRDIATVVGAGGPPDPAKLVEVMNRYGLVLARPATSENKA
jgi:quercetin dioxygenase-like cupin family protein